MSTSPSSSFRPRTRRQILQACQLPGASAPTFDRVVRLATEALDVPVAAIAFHEGDRVHYEATVGLEASECPPSSSLCSSILGSEGLTTFYNLPASKFSSDHPLWTHKQAPSFVAGVALVLESPPQFSEAPFPVGALWVADFSPRSLTEAQTASLWDLRAMVTEELERRAAGWRDARPFHHISDAYYALDTEWRFTFLNENAEQLLEKPAPQLLGRPLWDVFPELQDTFIEKKMRDAAEHQSAMSFQAYYRPLGKWLRISLSPFDGGLAVYFSDVTQSKERKELLRSINANVSEGLFRSTPSEGLVYANHAFARMFGYDDPQALLEVDSASLYANPEQREQMRTVEDERGFLRGAEIEFRRKDGSTFWGLTSSTVVYDDQDRPLYYDGAVIDITDRKERKEWLRLLERALDNAAEAVMVLKETSDEKTDAEIVYVNAAFSDMTGYSSEEVLGESPHLLEGSSTNPEVLNHLHSAPEQPSSFEAETVNYRADGNSVRVHWKLAPVEKENGRPTYWVAVLHDVTERRRMEQELRARESKVEALYTAMGELLRAETPSQVATHIESLVIDTLGYPLSAVRLVEDRTLTPVSVSPQLPDYMPERPTYAIDGDSIVADVFRSGETHMFDDIQSVSDSYDRGEARATVYVPLGPYGLISMASLDPGPIDSFDVRLLEVLASNAEVVLERTERESRQRQTIERIDTLRDISRSILSASSAQAVAHAALQRLTSLLPTLRGSVTQFDFDEDTAVVLAVDNSDEGSLAAGQELPLPHFTVEDDSILQQARHTSSLDPRSEDPIEQHLHSQGIRSTLNVPLFAEDAVMGALNLGAPEPNAFEGRHIEIAQEVANLLAVALRQAQYREELIEAKEEAEEMNRLKSAFLANMSHEIRTPLTSIIGFAEVLNEQDLGDANRFSELIEKSGTQLLETINSVLDLSKLEAGSMQPSFSPVELTELLNETVALFEARAEEEGVHFHATLPDPPVQATLDQGALQRILHNLLSNALKFTDEGGSVTLRAREKPESVVMEVEDTGIGIDPDFVPDLFEPFHQESSGTTRTHEGTGLGLSVTKQLIELMHGTIDVESTKGVGTCFTVRLPRHPEEAL